jgi:hypothetical protein
MVEEHTRGWEVVCLGDWHGGYCKGDLGRRKIYRNRGLFFPRPKEPALTTYYELLFVKPDTYLCAQNMRRPKPSGVCIHGTGRKRKETAESSRAMI